MTDAEKLVWSKVKGKQLNGYQFYRQKIIRNYIVDFYCPKAKLIIELDGSQHYSDEGKKKDTIRDIDMASFGLKVLRIGDNDVFKNIDGVMEKIFQYL